MGELWDKKVAWLEREETRRLARMVSLGFSLPICLAPAVAMHESAYGTSELAVRCYNEFGQKAWDRLQTQTPQGFIVWPRREDSWTQFGRDMRHSIHYGGAREAVETVLLAGAIAREIEEVWIKAIGPVYCPNDPAWTPGVLACLGDVWKIWGLT